MGYRNEAARIEIQQRSLEIRRRRSQQTVTVTRVGFFDLAYYWLALTLAVGLLVVTLH